MAPVLRSTQSPAKPTSSGSNSPATTPRKIPQCAQCGRRRAGHPRQGCPYAAAAKDDGPSEETNITSALGSMKLQTSPAPHDTNAAAAAAAGTWELEDTRAAVRQRRRRESTQRATTVPAESIASISSSSSEILNSLLHRTDTGDEDERYRKSVVRWQDALNTPKAKSPKSRAKDRAMPCTFPGTGPSVASVAPHPTVLEVPLTPKPKSEEPMFDLSAVPPSAKPRTCSMSSLQRSSFVDSLNSRYKQTTAYLLPKSDIVEIEAAALKHGFHTRRITSMESENEEQVLVVGQDPVDTQKFCATIEGQAKLLADNAKAENDSGRRSSLKTVAGAAVVGAVATFTGLAFS
ncbi:uncharacterized protein BT62DRAFT_1075017 [Guyanagaster necrorhizus]|uniref:Uncharacterized protein n=1 Tax=Guyanagaster necrorhizus TaxID=856835 RepID=A0A9P7VUK5_9AGAR|nr:uncharacterized protein BT62DRAFT_1075017 [Guyanagaster necrorhizus MCA 3950]KAG7447643.1 hypothetical protein BT62DRAFT_1075017 [Guyanagaster necrorhizus MCA 3950]